MVATMPAKVKPAQEEKQECSLQEHEARPDVREAFKKIHKSERFSPDAAHSAFAGVKRRK